MAFPVVAETATYIGGALATHPVTMPASVSAGDLLLMIFVADDVSGVTVTAPVTDSITWTTIVANTAIGTVGSYGIFAKDATTEPSTADVALGSAKTGAAHVLRITGWEGTLTAGTGYDISAVSTGDATAVTVNAATATWGSDDNLFVAFFVGANDGDVASVSAYPTNYSLYQTNTRVTAGGANNNPHLASCGRELASNTDDPGDFTLASADAFAAYVIVIRPAAAGGGATITVVPIVQNYRNMRVM